MTRSQAMKCVPSYCDPVEVERFLDHYVYQNPATPRIQSSGDWEVKIHSTYPVVATVDNLLTPEECESIIREHGQDLVRAQVHDSKTGEIRPSTTRTNTLKHLPNGTEWIRDRLHQVLQIPASRGESFQMLRYGPGEYFQPHDDFFHNTSVNSRVPQCGQRVATVLIYLNGVENGGGTRFTNLNDLVIDPAPGRMLYFEYTDDQSITTTLARHEGMPVLRGEKWVLTSWYRERDYC